MSKKIDEQMLLCIEPILAKTKTLQDITNIKIQIKLLDKDKNSLTKNPFSDIIPKAEKTATISAILKKYNATKYSAENIIKYETSVKEIAEKLNIKETDEKYKKVSFLSFKIDANGNHDITDETEWFDVEITRTCKDIKKEDIEMYFSSRSVKSILDKIFNELNKNKDKYGLTSCLQQAHFLAQITVESSTGLEEGTLYNLSNAQSTFKYYNQHNPNKLEKYTYVTKNGKIRNKKDVTILTKEDRIELLNEVYSDKNRSPMTKLGNDLEGDGYKFRGRGLKQLTGKYNYSKFEEWNNKEFSENVNFINNPDLVLTPKYAARSALYFWKENGLDELSKEGSSNKNVDSITKVINSALKGKVKRQKNFQEIWNKFNNKG